jgi:4-hydroxybenzoate polyprenyltransferase
MSRLLDYLRLLRFANVFTALADVLMGYACVQRQLAPLPPLAGLLTTSALLYLAGMVLNDVFDIEADRQQRPERPLPAGRISLRTARILGFTLLLVGVGAGWATAWAAAPEGSLGGNGLVAMLLAGCILAYDGGMKATSLGPVLMGGCRSLNVLLGASLVAAGGTDAGLLTFPPPHVLVAAAGIGVYVAGVTWYARREAEASEGWHLAGAILVMLGGIAVLSLLHRSFPAGFRPTLPDRWWLLMLGLLGLPIARRCAMTIANPVPEQVQLAVKHCLMSIIVLDAAVVFVVAGGREALVVLSLLIPATLLGRWVYST